MSDKRPNRKPQQVGKYELLEKVGQGGMSAVFKARDAVNGTTVAVKIASRAVINDPHLSRRFALEYDLVYALSHRNLVKVLDHGKHEELPYLVMEYVDGSSLAKRIAEQKCLREHEALSVFLPIADALTYLHGKKIIHRDIKPANILVASSGHVKLADLGLMKDLGSISRLTRTNVGLGTLHFASPEQFDDGGAADARSDIYSLAATLYTALTGEPPFGKGPVMSVLQRKLGNQFEAPIQKLPNLRTAVDFAIRMALHAEPAQRPASVAEFIAYLTGWKKYPADVQPPGIIGAVSVSSKITKKAQHERRANERYEVEVAGSCRAAGTGRRWASAVMDISTTGMCVQVSRRFEPGSVLEFAILVDPNDSAINQLACVRWIKAVDSKAWLLGCEFAQEMSREDLETLFNTQLDQTKVTKME
jgi:serine/threonine protein kinase